MKVTYIKTGKRMKENKHKKIEEQSNITLNKEAIEDYIKRNKTEMASNRITEKNNRARKQPKIKSKIEKIKNENKEENQNEEERKMIMKTILKKNQIVILTLALMLITAGYMNYNNSMKEMNMSLGELGDAKLVSTNIYENDITNKQENSKNNEIKDTNVKVEGNEINKINNITEEAVNQTNNDITNSTIDTSANKNNETNGDYFAQTRLDRESMYSQMLETYQKILENEKVPADQKTIASNEIKNISDRKSAISIAENLIKTKGFKDVSILINDNSINIVVKQDKNLTEEQVAQITNIISRELKAEIEDIHISVHK